MASCAYESPALVRIAHYRFESTSFGCPSRHDKPTDGRFTQARCFCSALKRAGRNTNPVVATIHLHPSDHSPAAVMQKQCTDANMIIFIDG